MTVVFRGTLFALSMIVSVAAFAQTQTQQTA